MGASPKQNDLASSERNSEHERSQVKALTNYDLERARTHSSLFDTHVVPDERIRGLFRAAGILIVVFQLGYAAEHFYTSAPRFDATFSLIAANLAIGVALFLSTFTAALPRYWSEISVLVCLALLITSSAIAAISMRIEPLFVSICVLVLGAGTLAPWDWRCQAAINAVGIICFCVLSRIHGIVDFDPAMHWLGLATAVGLAQGNVYIQVKSRRQIAQILRHMRSNDLKVKESEEKFRQIFQQSGDMVVVSNLETSTILEVNNQFVRRSVVQNLEVQLNGIGYARPTIALISAVVVRLNDQNCAITVVREIADVKEAERKLRNSEATLREIFDANLDSVATSDPITRRYTDVNAEFSRATGFSREEVLGKTPWEIGVWPSRDEADNFAAGLSRSGEVRNMRANFRIKDGHLIPCLISGVLLELDAKLSCLTITRNVSDLVAAEQRLIDSEASLRKIFDSILDPLSITDLEGHFVDVNDEFMRLSEYSRQEIIGQVSDNKYAAGYIESLKTTGQVRNFVFFFKQKRAYEIPVLMSSVVVELGGEQRVVTVARDITERKAQELKLQSSEAMLREIFDSSVDNIALTDLTNGAIIDVNKEMVRSLGIVKADLIGKRFDQLNVWQSRERLDLFIKTLLEHREVRNFEATFCGGNGIVFPALVSAVAIELGGNWCSLSITRDITDLEAARQKALAASTAKTEFLSSMSHEIRTPMNAILGMADLMGESDLDAEQRRYLDTIMSNGNALLELINGILDLARVESGRLDLEAVPFDVIELTEKVADTLAVRAHEKGIELAVRFSTMLPPMLVGDVLRLRQVLVNLIGNAIKFTRRGEIVIDVALNPLGSNPGSLLFSVRDTGVGVPGDVLRNIFSAFTQADSSMTRKFGGSGLGLTIVERLVALMGGKVWVESELGVGSIFCFTAELGLPPAVANADEAIEDRGTELSGVRVLVVDDNATIRSIVSEMLVAKGAVATGAASGAQGLVALDAANRDRAPFSLLVVDSQMPTMDGFEMIRRMRAGPNGNAPIVMLVTSGGLSTRLNIMGELAVNHYVVKPVKRHELFAAVSDAMAAVAPPARTAVEPHEEKTLNGSAAPMLDRPLRILLADDSVDNRMLITAYLKKTRYVLDQVEDGQAALNRFMTRAYDVVLMDIQMPVLDGFGAVRKIRLWETANQHRRTPIIALTASALESDVQRSREAGCDLHVSKPVKKSTLLRAISQVIAKAEHNENEAAAQGSHGDSSPVNG